MTPCEMRSYLSITFHSESLLRYPYRMHSVATFSVCFRGLSRLEDEDDLGSVLRRAFSSSCCWAKSRPNSATFGFSRFAGVPVRVRERAWSYRALRRLPNGPLSSGGRRGLRDSLLSWLALCWEELPWDYTVEREMDTRQGAYSL